MTYQKALLLGLLFSSLTAFASIFGTVSGLIHDPQHRPVQGAQVTLGASNSAWTKTITSDDAGEFHFDAVPLGEYEVTVDMAGFASQQQKLVLTSGRDARAHFSLSVAQAKETVEVSDTSLTVNPESSSTYTMVSRRQIAETPGADATNSLGMITNYVPSAYMVHDQLHIRGGHQVSWLLDGVPVPNTNIASNVGPQFNPKDVDYLEVQRGGYTADYGDRTYGVFNVVTRTGFERDRQGEVVASYGRYNNTDNQISFGDHTDRFAYFGSFSGYRTDLGLETSSTEILHDQSAGLGGFGSLIFNKSPHDQLRLVTSVRGDHYQVPNSEDQQDQGIRDVEDERDTFVNLSWLHTLGSGTVVTVSPFYHFNRANYTGNYVGAPDPDLTVPQDDRSSNYVGGVTSISIIRGKHNTRAGLQVWGAHDNQLFGTIQGDGGNPQSVRQTVWGNVETFFLEDQYRPTSWLTLNGGVRLTHFGEPIISENHADPRIGAAVMVPRLKWVLRAFYGWYYQPPPLLTVSGDSLLGFELLPLRGERDEQREFGVTIPIARWSLDVSNFRTGARNFFDHDALDNNIFIPLTIGHARIRGTEATLTSPRIADRVSFRAAYSNQVAQGSCPITGGFVEECDEEGPFYLDHDQRNTFTGGFNLALPRRSWMDFNVNYGSGFLNGEGDEQPTHLSPHTTFDLAIGKAFGENWNVRLTGTNLSNNRYLLDNANTFGGTHYVNPFEIAVQVKYKFRF
jgi:outer membrane receptor protein involved in Fe transport